MSVTRRIFIRNSATASAFAFAGVAPTLASSDPDENVELLKMEPQCAELEARCIQADAERISSRALYEALAPKLPQSLILPLGLGHCDLRWCCEQERDAEDRPIHLETAPSRLVFSSYNIEMRYPGVKDAPTEDDGYFLLEMRRLYKQAKRYESAVKRAKESSGLNAALAVMNGLYVDVSHYAYEVVKLDALTWRGVAIKGNAIELARRCNWDGPESFNFANHLARTFLLPDVVRVSKGGAL